MKKSTLMAVSFIVFVITISASSVTYQKEPESRVELNIDHQFEASSSYTFHSPIDINSNADFSSQGWPGNGTLGNPYVIEGLIIRVDTPCISISGTTVYFEVRSCFITSGSLSDAEGIYLSNVANGIINNCTIDMHINGIFLEDSVNCNLTQNTATDNRYFGFRLDDSRNCTLVNNTASDSVRGVFLIGSDNCTLSNNTVSNNHASGIGLYSSNGCTLTNNSLISNGFVISGGLVTHWFHDSSGNTVNNEPLGYFMNLNDTIIDCSQFAQVILVNCTDVIARNGSFSNNSIGMQLGFCTNCTLKQNTFSNNLNKGAILENSDNCALIENTASNCNYGFYLFKSDNCSVLYNIASGNQYGLYLEFSDNCTLVNNFMSNNSVYGCQLHFVDNCILINNTALDTSSIGFFLSSSTFCTLVNNTSSNNSDHGFSIVRSNNSTLVNNTASRNFYDGFLLSDSDSCTLMNNTATNNQRYGLALGSDCAQNTIYLNRLGDNGVTNAKDDGIDNVWDDGVSLGNYWMDYSGEGTYLIPGHAGSVDNYPFVWKPVSPTDDIALILVIAGTVFVSILGVIVIIFVYKKKHA